MLLGVVRQARCLGGDPLEDVVDEGVHDAHGFAGDARVGVDLLQHFVYVNGVAFLARLFSLLLLVAFYFRNSVNLFLRFVALDALALFRRCCCCYLSRHTVLLFCMNILSVPGLNFIL